MAKILEVKEAEGIEDVTERLEQEGKTFVLLAVSPKKLEMLKEENFDPSNPVVSAKTLGRIIKKE